MSFISDLRPPAYSGRLISVPDLGLPTMLGKFLEIWGQRSLKKAKFGEKGDITRV